MIAQQEQQKMTLCNRDIITVGKKSNSFIIYEKQNCYIVHADYFQINCILSRLRSALINLFFKEAITVLTISLLTPC
jgi:hypothetical protein